ncbi:MAG TPA: transcription antitermination factor NusB [Acidimicrobiales bacterium]|nr:transcription antitermination factor NusB [Acidimicrobiales bacterium]
MSTSPAPEEGAASRRRQARERALALLYEAEVRSVSGGEVLEALPTPADDYAVELVLGVDRLSERIDGLIGRHARGWALDRMPAMDRNILRMSSFELVDEPRVPVAVVIDEAVELARDYSTEESSRFVNGVLSAIAAEVRPS